MSIFEYIEEGETSVCSCRYPDYEVAVKNVFGSLFGLTDLVSKMLGNKHIAFQAAQMLTDEIVNVIAQLDLDTDRICGCYE